METTIMENQMDKKMENETETRKCVGVIIVGYIEIMGKKMEATVAGLYIGIL